MACGRRVEPRQLKASRGKAGLASLSGGLSLGKLVWQVELGKLGAFSLGLC